VDRNGGEPPSKRQERRGVPPYLSLGYLQRYGAHERTLSGLRFGLEFAGTRATPKDAMVALHHPIYAESLPAVDR
jgi:hypothetical protein